MFNIGKRFLKLESEIAGMNKEIEELKKTKKEEVKSKTNGKKDPKKTPKTVKKA